MNGLREVATKYHRQANAIAARGDIAGTLTTNQQRGIAYYRDQAAKVEALIRPEDSLEGDTRPTLAPTNKVTTADKVANPKELLEKVK